MTNRRPILGLAPVAALLVVASVPGPTLGHGPNPLMGTKTWDRDQVVGYQWASGAVPPSWMAAAIDAAAADVAESRKSRAATFVRQSSAPSRIWYSYPSICPAYGIACMDRSGVPDSFSMWFRPHGYRYDWGTLRWCQQSTDPANGCYDAENVALDEFGHVEILDHHVNFADDSDYLDSVVQAYARAKPRTGWNEHVFGRCDVARLQLEYELRTTFDLVSTCLDLNTTLTIAASATMVSAGETVRFTGKLGIVAASSARRLSGDPLSGRAIVLQRRAVGGTTWSTIATLTPTTSVGSYAVSVTPSATYDYRLSFSASSTEGLNSSTSSAIRVSYAACWDTAVRARLAGAPCA